MTRGPAEVIKAYDEPDGKFGEEPSAKELADALRCTVGILRDIATTTENELAGASPLAIVRALRLVALLAIGESP